LPSVPGAREDASVEVALTERPLQVDAVRLHRVEPALAVRERELVLAGLDGADGAGRDVLHPRNPDEAFVGHGATVPARLIGDRERRYPPRVATILLCGVDTFFRGKLEALLPGHHLVTTDSADWPDLVIADIARVEPEEVVDAFPDVPILGFGGHTDTSGLRRAHAAGFDQVLVKNALQERAAQVVEELTA